MLTWAKRIFIFSLTNLLVFTTLNISFLAFQSYFQIDLSGYYGLLIMSFIFGMGGAIISLFLSKFMAKMTMRVQVIDPQTASGLERDLLEKVYSISKKEGLKVMPEVGIYESPEINAFATGPSKDNALVAVSSGLLNHMNQDALEGVLAHEVAHIANGDMVTMTLLQGIINMFVIFFARIVARIITSNSDERSPFAYFATVIGLQIIFTLLGSIVVNFFSRYREFKADLGSAKNVGKEKMIKALQALKQIENPIDTEHKSIASLKIFGNQSGILSFLFSTHPSLDQRIERLKNI